MVEFISVSKKYPNGTIALDGMNLRINDGEFVFIVGKSGAGKSTLI
ncbi:MAG: ATP-binding cassette domain-containing protein, partial [Oscillospiraceae bacterium]|nr:ATP-binding cassette domain-containing protein [Oscillospiraceae bacterium]